MNAVNLVLTTNNRLLIMKKVVFFIAAFALFLSAGAQNWKIENLSTNLEGFRTNSFIDNWEVSAGISGQLFQKLTRSDKELNKGSFGNRVDPGFNIAVGKWITPIFGGRLQFQGYSMTTFDDAEVVNNWGYLYLHADLTTNLTNWICGYKSDRIYNAVLLTGFGLAWSTNDAMDGWNGEYVMTGGLQNRFRVDEAWDINLELKLSLLEQGFDNLPRYSRFGFLWDVSVGVTYKIPTKRTFDR